MSVDYVPWHVALDDTDSIKGMCTTYLGTVITWNLVAAGARLIDFPRLIRHNPNVPKKTRGNGGVAISAYIPSSVLESIEHDIIKMVESLSRVNEGANPGLIFVRGLIPPELEENEGVVNRIGCELVTVTEIHDVLERLKNEHGVEVRHHSWGKGDGLVGAFGALTRQLLGREYTFELLTYRPLSATTKPRDIPSFELVERLGKDFPTTIMNVDPLHGVVLIFPHGPDPVICGIRGTNPEDLLKFWIRLQNKTPLETMMIFRTNQHLDPHVKAFWKVHPEGKSLHEVKPHDVIVRMVKIVSDAVTIPGRHVFILAREHERTIERENDNFMASYCWLAAYEPTKQFRDYIRHLTIGDVIEVVGSVRKVSRQSVQRVIGFLRDNDELQISDAADVTTTINLEEFRVISLVSKVHEVNPRCPNCNKTLTSAGKNKGYKCKRCHGKYPSLRPIKKQVSRPLVEGKIYQAPPLAMRHVNMPKNVHFFKPRACSQVPNPEWSSFVHRYVLVMDKLLACRRLRR